MNDPVGLHVQEINSNHAKSTQSNANRICSCSDAVFIRKMDFYSPETNTIDKINMSAFICFHANYAREERERELRYGGF